MDCVHSARPDWLRIVDPRESLNCEDFTSTLTAGTAPFRAVNVVRTSAISVIVGIALMFGAVHLYRVATHTAPPVPLRATVSAPTESSADADFAVRVLVLNQGEHPAMGVQVNVGGKSLRNFVCQGVEPPEAFAEATTRSVSARLGRIEPGAIGSVTFHFSPKEPGEAKLVVQVTAANAELAQIVPIEGDILP